MWILSVLNSSWNIKCHGLHWEDAVQAGGELWWNRTWFFFCQWVELGFRNLLFSNCLLLIMDLIFNYSFNILLTIKILISITILVCVMLEHLNIPRDLEKSLTPMQSSHNYVQQHTHSHYIICSQTSVGQVHHHDQVIQS